MNYNQDNTVSFEHPEYVLHKNQVKLCMDFYDGIDTARQYLYARPNENDTDFYNRQIKAVLSNYVERIVTTQSGQIFSSPITYDEVPQKQMDLLDAEDIAEFAKDTCKRGIRDGKAFILLDIPIEGGEPYFLNIDRANVINWRKDDEGNYTMVVIAESYAVEEEFAIYYETQYRVIDEVGNIQIWRSSSESKTGWEVEEITTSYNFLPFYELHIGDIPPLYDIAVMNRNHFNAFSEKDTIISTATQPSFFTKGLGLDGSDLAIGVNYTINTDNPESSCEWIELDGRSIEYAQQDLRLKEQSMAERALQIQGESLQTKTATQVATENSESTSRLSDISEDLENTLNEAYNGWSMMKYSTEAVGRILLPNDFKIDALDSNLVNSLNSMTVAGNLSRESLLTTLSDAGIIEIDSVDDELKKIDAEQVEVVDEDIPSPAETTD